MVFFSRTPPTSLSINANRIGTGNTRINLSRLMTMVLVRISSKNGERNSSSKLVRPAHGLLHTPLAMRKSLNAMTTPYIGR